MSARNTMLGTGTAVAGKGLRSGSRAWWLQGRCWRGCWRKAGLPGQDCEQLEQDGFWVLAGLQVSNLTLWQWLCWRLRAQSSDHCHLLNKRILIAALRWTVVCRILWSMFSYVCHVQPCQWTSFLVCRNIPRGFSVDCDGWFAEVLPSGHKWHQAALIFMNGREQKAHGHWS